MCFAPFSVVLPGFEPRQTEPKSVVLPLHHKTKCCSLKAMQSYGLFLYCANFSAFFFEKCAKLWIFRLKGRRLAAEEALEAVHIEGEGEAEGLVERG